jgi:Flp pilus assembly protein TadD
MTASFQYDDYFNISENPDITINTLSFASLKGAWLSEAGGFRPVAYVSFALNYYFGGVDTVSYHVVNIIIHVINAYLIYLIMLFLFSHDSLDKESKRRVSLSAFFTALIWLVTPINSQAVIYIVQRMTLLMTLFFLLAFYVYLLSKREKKVLYLTLCLIFYFLSLLSKQNGIVLPLIIITYEFIFVKKGELENINKEEKLFLLALFILLLIPLFIYKDAIHKQFIEGTGYGFTVYERTITQFRVFVIYLSLVLLPVPGRLSLTHEISKSTSLFSPVTTFFSLIFIAAIFILAILRIKKSKLLSFAILWFFITASVEAIVPVELIYEQRIYLPPIFLIGSFVCFIVNHLYSKNKAIALPLLLCIVVVLGAFTSVRGKVWESELTLWKDVTEKYPEDGEAYYNVGRAYTEMRMYKEAEYYTAKALEIRLNNPNEYHNYTMVETYSNLGLARLRLGAFREAERDLLKAIEVDKSYVGAHYNLGSLYLEQRNSGEAVKRFREAINLDPADFRAYIGMGKAYHALRLYDEAIKYFKKAVELNPGNVPAYNEIGVIYMSLGKYEDARSYFKIALKYDPNDQIVLDNIRKIIGR